MRKSLKFALGLFAITTLLILSVFNPKIDSGLGITLAVLLVFFSVLVFKMVSSGIVEAYGKWIPNALTLGNLCLGVAAILYVSENPNSIWPAVFILIASVLDMFDGKLARQLNAVSAIGKELDSLSDLVTFGIAPMVLLWQSTLSEISAFGAIFVFFYAACGAYRLARYNVTTDCTYFMGMPITFAGILSVLWYMGPYTQWLLPTMAWIVFLGFAMVSKVRFKRLEDFKVFYELKHTLMYHKCKRMAKKATRL